MAFTPINDSQIAVGQPVKKSLWQKVKDNFDDLNARIISLDVSAGNVPVWQETLRNLNQGVGQIVASQLSETDFRKMHGNHWYLCNNQSIAGTAYATLSGYTTAPDFRGEFLRGLDNGRGIDLSRTMNSAQGHQSPAHTHDTTFVGEVAGYETAASGTGYYRAKLQQLARTSSTFTTGSTTNGNETRPRNVSVNYFIQANPAPRIQILLYQAKVDFTISDIKITTINQSGFPVATAGSCVINIKKGDLSTMTSIFTAKPTISSPTNGSQNGSYTFVDGAELVTVGQWIALDIDNIFPNQSCLVIDVYGVPVA